MNIVNGLSVRLLLEKINKYKLVKNETVTLTK